MVFFYDYDVISLILSCFEYIFFDYESDYRFFDEATGCSHRRRDVDCTVFGPREGALGAASEDGDELVLVELPPQVLFLGILRGEPACSSHEGNLILREHSTTSPHDSTTGTPSSCEDPAFSTFRGE